MSVENKLDYDFLIIGGGMAGASVACALSGHGLRGAMIEAVPLRSDEQPAYDDRAIALALGSQKIFSGLSLWQDIAPQAAPIKTIHVSSRGEFGVTRLEAEKERVEALGYVATGRTIGNALANRLDQLSDIDSYCPARMESLAFHADFAEVSILTETGSKRLTARLILGADGTRSEIRQMLNIPTEQHDYGQSAIIANVTPQLDPQGIAYERFTDTGPLAVLPMPEKRCGIVWTVLNEQLDEMMSMSDEDFIAALQQRFGYRLGKFQTVGKRGSFPLALIRANQQSQHRLVLIGNAAHTLHPVAGQGINLGLRDIAELTELILRTHNRGEDIGQENVLKRYDALRKTDHDRVITITDSLLRLFTSSVAPVKIARSMGLTALDCSSSAKHLLAQQMMGLMPPMSRLGRGLKLDDRLSS